MIKKWLKIFPVICFLTAQIIVAAHIHSHEDIIAEQECIYCQTAAKLLGSNTPETIVVTAPIYHQAAKITFLFQNLFYGDFSYHYNTRAPPLA